jgi:hypothetical protein
VSGIVVERLAHDAGSNQHCRVKVTLAGVDHFVETGNDEIASHNFNLPRFIRDLLHYMVVARGVPLSEAVGRVCFGEEATNVKQYTFCGPGAAVTMTNMRGAGNNTYANICPGTNGEWILVDVTGCTEFRPMLTANLVATGPFQFRIIRDSDNAVFYESGSITQTGERELDPGWLPIPAGFSGQEKLRIQAKSTVGTDDPVIRRAQLGVR